MPLQTRSASIEAAQQPSAAPNPSTQAPATSDPAMSVNEDPQPVDNGDNLNSNNAQTSTPQQSADTVTYGDTMTSSGGNMAPAAQPQPQVVMDDGGPSRTSSFEMTIPSHRTGLIRPTMSSTYRRPPDPVQAAQPGIITASIFAMFGILVMALMLVRRWRKTRTTRRTRSVINLLNRAKAQQQIGSTDSGEKLGAQETASEVENGLVLELGSRFSSSQESLATPVAAKTRPESSKGFNEGPFLTVQSIPSTFSVKFSVPHIPVKPSPLRGD